MNVLWDSFEIGVNCFQGFITMYFPFKYLGGRFSDNFFKNHGAMFSALLSILITIMNSLTAFEHFLALLYAFLIFLYSVTSLNGKMANKIFASIFPVVIVLVTTATTAGAASVIFDTTINDIYTQSNWKRVITVIATQLIIFYLIALSIKIFEKNEDSSHQLSKSEWILVSVTLLLSIVIGAFFVLISYDSISDKSRIYITLGILSIVVINLVSFYLIIDLGKKNLSVIENEKLKLQIAYNKQYVENADIEFNLIQKLRHDSKAVYQVLDDYLLNDNVDKARAYLRTLTDLADERIIFINTSNDVANSIINAKLTVAKSFGIHTTCMSVKNFNGIEDLDLCRLLSNMLDNAITATSSDDNPDKELSLLITEESGTYRFLVKNTIRESVLNTNPDLITTKNNQNTSGYGIRIIKDIAKKYNGHCEFYEKDSRFCCAVILNI